MLKRTRWMLIALSVPAVVTLCLLNTSQAQLTLYEGFNYWVPDVPTDPTNPGNPYNTTHATTLDSPAPIASGHTYTNIAPGVMASGLGNNGTTIGFGGTYEDTSFPGVIKAYGANFAGGDQNNNITRNSFPGDFTWAPQNTSIQYPAAVNPTPAMATIGNHYFTANGTTGHTRKLGSQFGDADGAGTVYYSYLINKFRDQNFGEVGFTNDSDTGSPVLDTTLSNVEMGFGGATLWYTVVRDRNTAANAAISYNLGGTGVQSTAPNQTPTWLVMEMTFDGVAGGAGDSIKMYINPRANEPITSAYNQNVFSSGAGALYAQASGLDIGSFGKLGNIGWGRDSLFDEIRLSQDATQAGAWSNLINSAPAAQGVPSATVGPATDPRSGVGYIVRREATADAEFGGPSDTPHTGVNHLEPDGVKTLFQFDVPGIGIPAGQTITSAKMVVSTHMLFDDSTGQYIEAYQILDPWTEGSSPTPTISATVLDTELAYHDGLVEIDIPLALAQGWYDGSIPDYGIAFQQFNADGSPGGGRRDFVSRHQLPVRPDLSVGPGGITSDWNYGYMGIERPLLLLNYEAAGAEVVPEPSTLVLGFIGLAGFGLCGWLRRRSAAR